MTDYSIVIYPSMQCSFRALKSCPYCWVDYHEAQTGVQAPLPWEQWRDFLLRQPPAVVDVVGGEPLQYRGLYDLLASISQRHQWALTTNLSARNRNYRQLVAEPLPNCAAITWSYHPFSDQMRTGAYGRFLELAATYPGRVRPSVVNYPGVPVTEMVETFRQAGYNCAVNDYQPPSGNTFNEEWQSCNGAHKHIIVGTDGAVYPCFAWYEKGESSGHIDSFTFSDRRNVCNLECGPCYRQLGNPFRIDLRPVVEEHRMVRA